MLLHERPSHNEKLQQDLDLEGKGGLNTLWFAGVLAWSELLEVKGVYWIIDVRRKGSSTGTHFTGGGG